MKKLSAAEKQRLQQQGKIVLSYPEKDTPWSIVASVGFFAILTGVVWIFAKESIMEKVFVTIFFVSAAALCVYAALVDRRGTWFVADEKGVLAQRTSGEYFLAWKDCKLLATGYYYKTWPFLICSTVALPHGEECKQPYNYISRQAMKRIKCSTNIEIPYELYMLQEKDGLKRLFALYEASKEKASIDEESVSM